MQPDASAERPDTESSVQRQTFDCILSMGTLSSELGPHAARIATEPRVYADANIPNGVVGSCAPRSDGTCCSCSSTTICGGRRDIEHYRLARQLGRTLVTLDRDYEDDRRFPPDESPGVIVFSAPDERWLRQLLKQADRRDSSACDGAPALPLEGRKLLLADRRRDV